MSILHALLQRLPGSFGLRDGMAWSTGHTATLPPCDGSRRGEERRVEGGAGVADRFVRCVKDAADAYAWVEVELTALDARYVNVSGDTMTGNLIVEKASPIIEAKATGATNPQIGIYDTTDGGVVLLTIDGVLTIGRANTGGSWTENLIQIATNDDVTITNLAGTGTRVVTASSTGVLGASVLTPGTLLIAQDSDYTGTNVNTAQKIFDESTNGAATVAASTAYLFEALVHIHTTGTTSHDLRVIFNAGTCTFTSMDYAFTTAVTAPAATEVSAAVSNSWVTTAGETLLTAAVAAATHHTIKLEGVVRINAGGTFIPQYRWGAPPGVAGVTLRGSYLRLTPFGSNTATTVGAWT